jgi:hypothetical protein
MLLMDNNKYNDLFIEDDNEEEYNIETNDNMISSDTESPKEQKVIKKIASIDSNLNQINSKNNIGIYDAATGIDVCVDNNESKKEQKNNNKSILEQAMTPSIPPPSIPQTKNYNNNGWDDDANITIKNWYQILKQQSFIYQHVLDKNKQIADKLSILSIVSSSVLGIFSGFKLWINNIDTFQTISDIILMLLNFVVAMITAMSKRYIDDKKNEKIRLYIEDVDNFVGIISAQVLNSPVYRMNADRFFKINNAKYTQLISNSPNLSITEINEGKQKYIRYKEHCVYNV